MKKQYISPKSEVFECKVNGMMMASANLDSLIGETSGDIVPVDVENPGEFSGRGDAFSW